MLELEPISDPSDPRLRLFLNLKDRDIRRETGLFLAEGEHVVRRGFAAGLRVRSVLVVEAKADRVRQMAVASPHGPGGVEVLPCRREVIADAVGFAMHQGILAVAEPPPEVPLPDLLAAAKSCRDTPRAVVMFCPEVTNVDNLGLLVRVAAALGVRGLVLGPRSADPWYRRAVRVAMGAGFTLPMARVADDHQALRTMHDAGFTSLATVLDADAPPLVGPDAPPLGDAPVALLLGSEGYGLPPELAAACARRARIPMHHDVDSLNVAVAAGIVVHHLIHAPAPSPPGGE
ncbi:MAG: RNA methyltransferase [Planctomycetota bacterium]